MDARHSINGLVEILAWMESQQYEKQEILKNTGIASARLNDPLGTLSKTEELTFYQNLLDVSSDPHIILKAGFRLNLSTYGIYGLALLSSPSLRNAIEFGLKYITFTYTYNTISFSRGEQRSALKFSKLCDLGPLQKPMVERDLATVYMLSKALLQQSNPFKEIRVTWADNNEETLYQQLFHCPVHFNCEDSEIFFDNNLLDLELPQSNLLTMQMCKQQLDQQLPEISLDENIATRIQHYLLRTPPFKANIHDCSKELNLSTRHLGRMISNEGSTFKKIMDQFKQSLSERYLTQTDMTLEIIAERLGYSDAASFSHAFKRWTGYSPRKFRSEPYSDLLAVRKS